MVLDSLTGFPAWYRSARPVLLGVVGEGLRDPVRQVPRVHEQRPGQLADPRPQRDQGLLHAARRRPRWHRSVR